MSRKRIAIVGGGFGGLNAAKELKGADAEVILIDRTNHHLFQPLLYQVATAALSPGDIAMPIRGILNRQENVTVLMGEVDSINAADKFLEVSNDKIDFDYLILAPGARHSYFGSEAWEQYAPGLKSLSDALKIRENILLSFEKAERYFGKGNIDKYLTFVIVGGGPTGVEMAGAIAEISKKTMLKDFRKIDPSKTKVILVEGTSRILNTYDQKLSEKAAENLRDMGVKIFYNTFVTEVTSEGVKMGDEFIATENVIWAAGNSASPLIRSLKTELDKFGRALVLPDCSVEGYPYIFVIGDAANLKDNKGDTLPGVAPVAVQQGKFVANLIAGEIKGKPRSHFTYVDKGSMATIGRAKAVMQTGKIKISGFIAWLAWSFVHVFFLISFRNKYKVMAEWIWYYISYRHGIRLITNRTKL